MSLQDILALEQTNTHHIYFYREGVLKSQTDMKTNYRTSTLRRCLSSVACGILLTALTGCGDNRSTSFDDDLPNVGELVEINILTNGIESFADAEEAASRSALAGGTVAEQPEQPEQTVHTQVQPLEDGRLLVATVKASKATRAAGAWPTSTRANTSTTLRVLAYNSEGKYVDECLYNVDALGIATAAIGQHLVVPARATAYTFYCYSPGGCYSNAERKEVSVGAADAFAFGTQQVVINGSSSTQSVSFPVLAQKMASIKLAVTSAESNKAVDRYTAVLSGGTFVNSATFSLTSGAYSSFGAGSVQSKPFDASIAEHLILPSGSTGEMTLKLSNLVVDGKALSSPSFKIPAITLTAGTRYTLSIKVQSLPTVPFVELPAIGLRVAKGNLMRAGAGGHWYLAPDQGYYTGSVSGGDYFCWGIADPTSSGNNTGTSMAALSAGCVAVLGSGWRVPTKADNEKLAGGAHVWGTYRSQGNLVDGYYFGISGMPALADRDKYVFLPAAGYRHFAGGMTNVGSSGYYWCSEPRGGYYAYDLTFNSSAINRTDYNFRSDGHSVRCVADN